MAPPATGPLVDLELHLTPDTDALDLLIAHSGLAHTLIRLTDQTLALDHRSRRPDRFPHRVNAPLNPAIRLVACASPGGLHA